MMFEEKKTSSAADLFTTGKIERKFREPRHFALSEADLQAHKDFLAAKIKGALWYVGEQEKPAE